jgi:hypothetical protein
MARPDAFDDPMTGGQVSQRVEGGWRQLLWFAVAAAGLGFAGYVYVVPYRHLTSVLDTRSRELREQRSGGQEVSVERDRLKTNLGSFEEAAQTKAAAVAKSKHDLEALATQLKLPLEALGASINMGNNRLQVGLAPDKAIDKNGIDVSSEGAAVLKLLAASLKTIGGNVFIKARFGTGPAPKQLRSLFSTVGEVSAVRAARVMSALEADGIAPTRLSIVGEPDAAQNGSQGGSKPAGRGGSRRRRAAAAAAAASAAVGDRLDIEVEPG